MGWAPPPPPSAALYAAGVLSHSELLLLRRLLEQRPPLSWAEELIRELECRGCGAPREAGPSCSYCGGLYPLR